MTRTRYGISPWLASAPRTRRAFYPRLADRLDVTVAIIGGGLTGAATAYAFAAAGVRVALLEADRVASGATAAASGLALADLAADYHPLEAAYGRRQARAMWQAMRRAALEFAAAVRRLNIRCGLGGANAVAYARTPDQAKALQRDLAARRDAGLEGTWLSARALAAVGVEAAGGIRTSGHARVDPWRACHGFARAAAVRGAGIFEQSPVGRIAHTRSGLELATPRGIVACETVIVATGEPTPAFHALERHFLARDTYVVQTPSLPAAVRQAAGDRTLVRQDRQEPSHRLYWTADDRIVWSGADQPRPAPRLREKVLVQRTGQLMYELSLALPAISGIQPERGWTAPYSITHDRVPFIGPHRNYPRHLFALGQGTNLAAAFLAARVLLRHHGSQADQADAGFGFARLAR